MTVFYSIFHFFVYKDEMCCCCECAKLCPCCVGCCRKDSGKAWGITCACFGTVVGIILSPLLGMLILLLILLGCLLFFISGCGCCFCCGHAFKKDFQNDVRDSAHTCSKRTCCCWYLPRDYSFDV